ncbi:phytanoyl-CoA dioxygenase family protein [Penicillium subrubescens]|uniref:Phytanoyl-CoA dioxygenase family protein n=1 Tax=Penicillium subrubescens TaxID=1316194 RepID=A0A1Q5UBN5_9EURO|nr:phytanoyl-CoA dioxygenase family protein [Penicillium subrubescens]KAJ5904764.1 phytanoyl-CoA dioxygenase family protein [Penicillium subrubescens]OKP09892.1 hypothetical protein PENSUB_4723 [Penicillium subrubescens]
MTPKFELRVLERESATLDTIIPILKHNGGVVIRNFMSPEILGAVIEEVKPHFGDHLGERGEIFAKQSQVVSGLAAKSPSFVENIICDPLYGSICDYLLTSRFTSWYGSEQVTFDAQPQLNAAVSIRNQPGGEAQKLHRDDMGHHNHLPRIAPEEYAIGRDTGVGIFVAATHTSKENGATRFIPGSHLWGPENAPDESLTVPVELNPGDVFFMLASCYHGGSANTTMSEQRMIFSAFMTKGFLRQEENQYLTVPKEKLQGLSVEACRRLGFAPSEPFLGWVDLNDPRTALGLPTELKAGETK